MKENVIKSLDQIKDRTEEVWVHSSSIRNSLRILGTCLQESQHDSSNEMRAIAEIYIILSEVMEKKIEHIMCELSTVLTEIKQEAV